MHILNGHYQDTSGLLTIGKLMVEERDGQWYHAEMGWKLTAEEIVMSRDSAGNPNMGVEITGDFVGAFVPDNGECERVGMPVAR